MYNLLNLSLPHKTRTHAVISVLEGILPAVTDNDQGNIDCSESMNSCAIMGKCFAGCIMLR